MCKNRQKRLTGILRALKEAVSLPVDISYVPEYEPESEADKTIIRVPSGRIFDSASFIDVGCASHTLEHQKAYYIGCAWNAEGIGYVLRLRYGEHVIQTWESTTWRNNTGGWYGVLYSHGESKLVLEVKMERKDRAARMGGAVITYWPIYF